MERLWVVEWSFGKKKNLKWEVCSSSVCEGFHSIPFVSTNFYEAHKNKRKIQEILQKEYNCTWYKNRFRVREYKIRYQ
jgi:hypothetical protein